MSIVHVWFVAVAIAIVTWVFVWIGRETALVEVFEPAVLGLGMSVIGISTLVGFYSGAESADTKMRTSIAAAFSATYIYLLTSVVLIGDLRLSLSDELAKTILDNFTIMVTTILGFYFASRALENVNAAVQVRKTAEAGGGTTPPATPQATSLSE